MQTRGARKEREGVTSFVFLLYHVHTDRFFPNFRRYTHITSSWKILDVTCRFSMTLTVKKTFSCFAVDYFLYVCASDDVLGFQMILFSLQILFYLLEDQSVGFVLFPYARDN
jgi:hypothetical protein